MRLLIRLLILALAAYGAKTLYDRYACGSSALTPSPPADGDADVGQVFEGHEATTRWSVGEATDVG